MRFFRDAELPREVVAARGERLGLLAEKNGVEHHAAAYDVLLAALKNTRRNRAQDVFLTVEFQRMTGIGTALKTCHDLVGRGQHVDDLAFAFVSPLQSEDDVHFFHVYKT